MSQETMDEMKRARKALGINRKLAGLRKQSQKVQQAIEEILGDDAKTAPEIARMAQLDVREVFWQLNAMRKYGQAAVEAQDGSHLTYRIIHKAD